MQPLLTRPPACAELQGARPRCLHGAASCDEPKCCMNEVSTPAFKGT